MQNICEKFEVPNTFPSRSLEYFFYKVLVTKPHENWFRSVLQSMNLIKGDVITYFDYDVFDDY